MEGGERLGTRARDLPCRGERALRHDRLSRGELRVTARCARGAGLHLRRLGVAGADLGAVDARRHAAHAAGHAGARARPRARPVATGAGGGDPGDDALLRAGRRGEQDADGHRRTMWRLAGGAVERRRVEGGEPRAARRARPAAVLPADGRLRSER